LRLKLTKRMKNFSYLIVLLFSITLASCGDMNEFTPKVENPDVAWKLSYYTSFNPDYATSNITLPASFKWSRDISAKRIAIKQVLNHDVRANTWTQDVKTTNNDTKIEITYTQTGSITSLATVQASTTFEHFIDYSIAGKGSGAAIPVKVKIVYTNPALGFNTEENYTITF
jgi:hypothetical protein